MIQSIIIEDNPLHRKDLIDLIEHCDYPISILSTPTNVAEALEAIHQFSPELVFLDVELGGDETGFDLLKSISQINFDVIFTTSHANEAINAFRISALDFLVKPINPEEFSTAVKKFMSRKEEKIRINMMEILLKTLQEKETDEIIVYHNSSYLKLKINNIMYCGSNNTYTDFFLSTPVEKLRKITSTVSIGEWEERLSRSRLIRIYNRWLANIDHIVRYSKAEGCYMTDGKLLEVSKRGKSKLKMYFP